MKTNLRPTKRNGLPANVLAVVNRLIDLNPDPSRDRREIAAAARDGFETADAMALLTKMRGLFGGSGGR